MMLNCKQLLLALGCKREGDSEQEQHQELRARGVRSGSGVARQCSGAWVPHLELDHAGKRARMLRTALECCVALLITAIDVAADETAHFLSEASGAAIDLVLCGHTSSSHLGALSIM